MDTSKWKCVRRLALMALLTFGLAGCVPEWFADTPFDREASDAASTLSAAATTLEYLHEGDVDIRFAKASMSIYRETLTGVAASLPGLRGAPREDEVQPAVSALNASTSLLEDPCYVDDCDWRTQVTTMRDASDALLELAS